MRPARLLLAWSSPEPVDSRAGRDLNYLLLRAAGPLVHGGIVIAIMTRNDVLTLLRYARALARYARSTTVAAAGVARRRRRRGGGEQQSVRRREKDRSGLQPSSGTRRSRSVLSLYIPLTGSTQPCVPLTGAITRAPADRTISERNEEYVPITLPAAASAMSYVYERSATAAARGVLLRYRFPHSGVCLLCRFIIIIIIFVTFTFNATVAARVQYYYHVVSRVYTFIISTYTHGT